MCGDAAVGGERDARAVEDERIVAAHLVDINHGALMGTRQGVQHFETHGAFFDGVRRRGDINDDAGSLRHEIDDRIRLVELLGPEIFVVPDVFADGDAQLLAAERKNLLARRGLEIARLVEDVVGGQQHLVLLEGHAAFGEQSGGVPGGFAGGGMGARGVANQDGQGRFLSERGDGGAVAFEEGRALEQVLRKIAAQAEFGENGQIGAAAFGFGGHVQDAGGVAGEIAYGRIELAEGNFHGPKSRIRGSTGDWQMGSVYELPCSSHREPLPESYPRSSSLG